MDALERVEKVGGAALFSIPFFDFFVWALDTYARGLLLMNLQEQLPAILFQPWVPMLCVMGGLGLLYKSHRRHVQHLQVPRGVLDSYGAEYRQEGGPKWLLPVIIVFLLALVAVPVLSVTKTLGYKGTSPKTPAAPIPPAIAYETTPKPLPVHTRFTPMIFAMAPNGIANAAPNRGSETVNNFGPIDRHVSASQHDLIVSYLRGKTCNTNFIGVMFDATDGRTYGAELLNSFKDAGCSVPKEVGLIVPAGPGPEPRGIKIEWNMGSTHPPNGARVSVDLKTPAGTIIDSLLRAGIACCLVGNNRKLPEGEINVIVARQ